MSIFGNRWRSGRAQAWLEKIPEAERCETCGGSGEAMTKHTFGRGYEYMPCWTCVGSGRKQNANP